MTSPRLRHRAAVPLLSLLLLVGLAACSPPVADEVAAPAAPAPGVDTPDTTVDPEPEPALAPIAVDWSTRDLEPVTLVDGRTIQACAGDGPFLCVLDRAGRQVGVVELGQFPATGGETDVDAWLRDHVRDFESNMRTDRLAGCGGDYRFALAEAPTTTEVDGSPAVTYRYVGTRQGTELERGVVTLVRRDDQLLSIAAIAYDPNGCIGTEGGEFTPAGLETFEPAYDALLRGSRLP